MNANVAAPMPAAEVSSLGGRTIRRLLFLVAAVPVGAVAFAILVAGWIAIAVVSITPLVVPVLMALRAAVGGLARADAGLANALLGTATRPDVTSPGLTGYWRRAGNILGDGAFWRQQSYLLLRLFAEHFRDQRAGRAERRRVLHRHADHRSATAESNEPNGAGMLDVGVGQ